MARQNRSESNFSLDRRRLLTTAVAVTVAGVVPTETTEAAPSAQAAIRAPVPVAHYPPLNVCASTAQRIEEIAARNIIRAEAGLPLLSITRELRRMKNVDDAAEFEEFADRHRQAVWEEVSAPVRVARGEPNWRPRRLMEGFAFQAQVSRILRERFAGRTGRYALPAS